MSKNKEQPTTDNRQPTTKILVLDNYDSFTYNLVQMIEEIVGEKIDVFRNDEIALEEVEKYDKIILSPGPGIPEESGILLDLIKTYSPTKSIFGVCLGLQAIGEAFDGKLINLSEIFHGVATDVKILNNNTEIFKNFPETFEAGRYHSWAVSPENFPEELEITAVDKDEMIMALQHKTYDVQAVQFHPESILTPKGREILENFLT
ncbi:anthranilate synthase component 2 [Halpernia humi]|uniref:Anthranilate synthase component 2 n=1 Tax=Halpernia humi TaxID=493375 RepID=A0A1H6B408_9FLAO|nr:aminodeoxychorismate/anthranilate synthase component II [Halpernia humi]SEG55125.1 anthranilate synthase component 2 [Halpernia humi]